MITKVGGGIIGTTSAVRLKARWPTLQVDKTKSFPLQGWQKKHVSETLRKQSDWSNDYQVRLVAEKLSPETTSDVAAGW